MKEGGSEGHLRAEFDRRSAPTFEVSPPPFSTIPPLAPRRIDEFRASDGCLLKMRRWIPTGEARGAIVALHGIQSHSGWYHRSSQALCEAGWDVRFLDRRGSGLNTQDRGHAAHADRLVHDAVQLLGAVRHERSADRPVVLLGLSWGGRLATCVAARRPDLVDALVLLYPAVCARVRPGWIQRRLLGLACALGDVRRTAPIPLDDPELFTSVREWQEFIRNDSQALHRATVGFFAASLSLEEEAQRSAPRLTMPTLIQLAGRDRIIDSAGVREWSRQIASSQLRVLDYAEAAHTLEFEPCFDDSMADLLEWLRIQETNASSPR